jgi:hypothetical protein
MAMILANQTQTRVRRQKKPTRKNNSKKREQKKEMKETKIRVQLCYSAPESHPMLPLKINPSGNCNRELKPLKPQGWLDALPEEMQPEKCNVPGTAAKNEEGQILKNKCKVLEFKKRKTHSNKDTTHFLRPVNISKEPGRGKGAYHTSPQFKSSSILTSCIL